MASSIGKMLECPVCFEKMCLPKLLPCGHTFCIVCLSKMADNTKKNKIECPNCRKIHNLPKDGVNGFNNNYTLIELISLNVDSLVQKPTPSAPLLSSISTQRPNLVDDHTLIQNHAWWYHETTPENIRKGMKMIHLHQFSNVLIGPSVGMLGFGIYLKSKPPKVHLKYFAYSNQLGLLPS